jgi:hypothetical protein
LLVLFISLSSMTLAKQNLRRISGYAKEQHDTSETASSLVSLLAKQRVNHMAAITATLQKALQPCWPDKPAVSETRKAGMKGLGSNTYTLSLQCLNS